MRFEEIARKYGPKIKAIAHRLNGRYTAFCDDDLCQEAVLYLWIEYKKNGLKQRTDSHIFQGCFFVMKNFIRRNYKAVDRRCFSLEKEMSQGSPGLEILLPLVRREEVRQDMEARILKSSIVTFLSSREKEVFDLNLKGHTVREIGRNLGISHASVVKINKRIRAKGRRFLDSGRR
jgi:RNA polymerase sigma factor (sigma-70 family)